MVRHIVCYSGGHSSAIVAIEVTRRFGKEDVILLNHDINGRYEAKDIKRFKNEVALYLGLPITYVNHPEINGEIPSQFDVSIISKSFVNPNTRQGLCTTRLKTEPFKMWLDVFYKDDDIIYYGFDANEWLRIQRRSGVMGEQGYKTDYPLALWSDRTIYNIEEVGIEKPCVYGAFKHANCIGCIKAKKQHWYVTFCLRPDIWVEAKRAEETIGYSIQPNHFLAELEPDFTVMRDYGIKPSEHIPKHAFWKEAKLALNGQEAFDFGIEQQELPCECSF